MWKEVGGQKILHGENGWTSHHHHPIGEYCNSRRLQ